MTRLPLAFAALLVATPVGAETARIQHGAETGDFAGQPGGDIKRMKRIREAPNLRDLGADAFAYSKDGDTFVLTTGEVIRIRSERGPIDAPESSVKGRSPAKCPLELFRAQAAKDRLSAIMRAAGDDFSIDRRGLDRYRRTIAVVYAVGEDVGVLLVKEGHAKMWPTLRTRDRPQWCQQS